MLLNAGEREAAVRVLGVSNGGSSAETAMAIPSGEARNVSSFLKDAARSPVWVTRLDVPDGVLIDGRLEYRRSGCVGPPPSPHPRSKVTTPVFRALTPAGVRTIHTGSDLGAQDVRTNVGIYNAGAVTATATVEVRRAGCASETAITRDVSVPPDTIIQISVFDDPLPCATSRGLVWPAFTTVSVDQPSLSYVVSLSDEQLSETLQPDVTVGFATQQ
ncbi:MAG TPA: hypothetical protein VF911_07610 [Thermoanaerobaculia bacterium]